MSVRRFGIALVSLLGVATTSAAKSEEDRISGFYAGLFAGAVILDSTVSFGATASRPTSRFVDQGGDGVILTARGGWGTVFRRHGYVGIEGEFILPYDVNSKLNTMGVEYRARLRNEFGVYGRLGWTPDRRSLIYLRAGVTMPRQSFQSVSPNSSQNADWSVVPAVGLGSETHVTRRAAVRIDATYSFPTGRNDIESYRVTAGMIWRF